MAESLWRIGAASGLMVLTSLGSPAAAQNVPSGSDPAKAPVRPTSYEIRFASRSFTPRPLRPNWGRLLARGDRHGVRVVVQLIATPDLTMRAQLAEAGITLGQPLTGHAFLAWVEPRLNRRAAVLDNVRWADLYQPKDKLSPSLTKDAGLSWAKRKARRIELVVSLFADKDIDEAIDRIKGLGGTLVGEARRARVLTISLPLWRQEALAGLDAVRWIEPSLPPPRNESERARASIGADVGAIPAGRPNGAGVVVGVLEEGHAQTNHPDFGGRVSQGDSGSMSYLPHTTMTAGMIAGSGAQSLANGAAAANQWRGVAPAASILTYNYLNLPPGGDAITKYINDVTEAVEKDGVDLMNNSWGDFSCTPLAFGDYVGRAPFLDGVVKGSLGRPVSIVFSAGNNRNGFFRPDGSIDMSCLTAKTLPFANYTTLNHPKSAKNMIVVGAVDSANNQMSVYSNWGPTRDGRIKPDLVAAGHHNGKSESNVSVLNNPLGTPPGNANQQDYRVPIFDNQYVYGWYAQTSSAAAEVSGGLALMIDGWRKAFPNRADPLPSTLRAVLVNNTVDLDSATTWFNRGPDFAAGYGLVQINTSVQSLERGDALEGSLAQGEEKRYFVAVPAGASSVRMTLAWDDEAANPGTNPALVNDLDLVVIDPNGSRRYPWTLNPANPTADAVRTVEDHVNNLEQVQVDTPIAGNWSLIVRGTKVASGRQNFSLVSPYGFSRQPVDLILALDTSNSMNATASPNGLSKIELLKRSVRLLLDTWDLHALATDRLGLTAFSSNVRTTPASLPALQPFQANVTGITTALSGLQASGCTALGGALQTAFNSFDQTSTTKRTMLVVSDGMQSANPFVGEKGGHLQIAAYSASPLPFDAFFCTTDTAKGPSGLPIVPDGLKVSDHKIEIHTIGVGVNGAGFQTVMQRLASENKGISHFTTTPDSNLDILYINDLVRALKSNTLQIITTDSAALDVAAQKAISFPINATSRSVTLTLSWSGADQANAVAAEMRGPGGTVLRPSQVRSQPYFTVLRFDIAKGTAAVPGPWTLNLRNQAGKALNHQLSVIADDSCFHYDVDAPGHLMLGKNLTMTASASAAGQPVNQLSIQARVLGPVNSLSHLLASAVPQTRAGREYLAVVKAGRFERLPHPTAVMEAALAELSLNKAFMEQVAQVEIKPVTFRPTQHKWLKPALLGESRFLATSTPFSQVGAYQVKWQVSGPSACGRIQREALTSILVNHARFDPRKTEITFSPGPRGKASVRIKPVDANGLLLGPGRGELIQLDAITARPTSSLIDLLDGSYLRSFAVQGGAAPDVKVRVGRETWTRKPVILPK
jgi:hypothetical protein